MSKGRLGSQTDLFAEDGEAPFGAESVDIELIAPIAGVRAEIASTLSNLSQATKFPWLDGTAALLARMRFEDLLKRLPQPESDTAIAAYHREWERLWAALWDATHPECDGG